MRAFPKSHRCNGFALVVTLALMVLLTLLAVGLLALSSVSLRSTAQGEAMATARANARLALLLALGELQRSAGPDQRVTARANILDEKIANPQLTGVWESSEIKAGAPPKAADYELEAKNAKFRAWLVSSADPLVARQATFASQAPTSPVTLWGKGTLGGQAPAKSLVTAGKVTLASSPGALAWAVLDEGTKARINTPYIDDAVTSGAKTAQLGTGERPGVEFITGLAGLERAMFEKSAAQAATIGKGITRLNFALAGETLAKGTSDALKSATHDVTTHSVGLLTDVAHGGLKQDFQLLTNTATLPTLAKVQMLFSLIGHDMYSYPPPIGSPIPDNAPHICDPQSSHFLGTKYKYDLHLLYTPIVTLHNPFNVALECTDLRVEFVRVPFAMQLFRNGVAQSKGLVPLETMYGSNTSGAKPMVFGMNLKSKSTGNLPDTTTFRLLPGEVKVFSPYIDPNRTYLQEQSNPQYWYWAYEGLEKNINAIPGWRGYGIGFDCDYLAGGQAIDGNKENGHWESCMGLAADDQFHVLFAPLSVPASGNKFTVQLSIPDPQNPATRITVNAIEMDYESPTGLQDFIIGKGGTLRYPKTGTVRGFDMVEHAQTAIKDLVKTKAFALLSVQAKSTSGARDPSNEDGRLGTKPWCFAHANIGASTQKVVSEHCANFSHEIDLQLLDLNKGATSLVSVDKQDRGNFISGHSSLNGTKFGVQYDVPLAPLQAFATLNGANPGGASGFLPRFAQPIGNSWAHPLISPSKLSESRTAGHCLDHSFLLNLAFYDSFYFSGLADQVGPFGATAKTAVALAGDFAAGKPLDDPRLQLHRPDNRPASEFAAVIAKADASTRVAAWQWMAGAFNVNSTSVLAWKAMLGSIHDSQALVNQPIKTAIPAASKLGDLTDVGKQEARISRLRLPVSNSAADGAELKDGYWLGPREYSESQLQDLATNIVKQVRRYGPFLSMAEFVNRRLGIDDKAQRGALQQAIDDSAVNPAIALKASAGFEIPAATVKSYKYLNAPAGAGPSYQGAPGFLTQADLLAVLGNAATPRSDTFTIRGYGEARDAKGHILASAICEAVVQRLPEWVDATDSVETAPAALRSQSNKTFGRRFLITSLRWLNASEI